MTGCGRKLGPYDCCTVVCGDCLELMKALPDGCVDAVITDPPYGAGYAANPIVGKGKIRSNHDAQSWDDVTVNDLHRAIRAGKIRVVWGGNYYLLPASRGWLIWHKPDAPPSMADCELAWTNVDMNAQYISHSIAATNAERVGHPTQKPVRVMHWTIEQVGEAETILDPFLGSGTTAVAAKKLGRHFLGFEISPEYCRIAEERIRLVEMQPQLFEKQPEQVSIF